MLTHAVPTISKIQGYNRQLAGLKALRQRHEPHWQDIRDFIAPDSYEDPSAQTTNEGERRDSAIVNNTPTLALETAVSGLFNGTCDPTERWFGIEAVDPELNKVHAVQVYLDETTDRLLGEINRSNFHKQVAEDFRSLLAFGTCATFMEEVFGADAIINFQSMPIASYYVANNFRREVNLVARDLRMTASQMVEKFGDKCSSAVKTAAQDPGRGQQEFPVVHIVHENKGFNPRQAALSYDKEFRSCYYEPSTEGKGDQTLEEGGFSAFPVACARWNTTGPNPWGFGCGRTAIGDCRALMAMEVDSATAVELQIKPPLIVPSGMAGAPISLIPGTLNYAPDGASDNGISPILNVQHDLSHSTQKINEHEDRIDRAFFVPIFLMLANDDGGKMTATEVRERAQEKRLALTPILRVGEEYHKPIIRYLFALAGKRGRLPEPPPELQGQEIRITLKSVLFAAAELERNIAVRGSVAYAMQVGELRPDVLDNLDFDKIIREDFRRSGAPGDLLLDPGDVQADREARAAAAAKQAQGERANLAAQTAQTLASTPTDTKNALTDIMAGMQQ